MNIKLWKMQYFLLVQKNLKLKKASKVATLLECLFPIFVSVITGLFGM